MLLIFSTIKESLIHFAGHLPPELGTLFISMLPIFELRGGIPVAFHLFHLPLWKAFLFSYVGNLLPVIPILYLLRFFSRIPFVKGYLERTEKRGQLIEKYEALGLTMFVGVPLPVTGAWTGALLAFIFNIPILKSFLFISIGVFAAGIIVSFLTLMGIWGAIIAGILIFTLITISFLKNKRLFIILFPLFLLLTNCIREVNLKKENITIGVIQFKGNDHIPSDRLLEVMKIKRGDVYNEEKVRYSMKKIIQYYKDKGFWSARIIQRKGNYNPVKKEVNFTIVIFEGSRCVVSSIDIEGNNVFDDKEILKIFGIRQGEPFDAAKIARGEYLLSLRYADLGYIDAVIRVQKERVGNAVNLLLHINEGNKYFVRKVRIKGLKNVRWKIVRREIILKKGMVYSPSIVYDCQGRIYRTGLFEQVNFSIKKVKKDSLDVVFKLKEMEPRWIGFGFGYESPERILIDGSWGHNNLFGNLQRIKINVGLSWNFQGGKRSYVSLNYEEPYLLGSDVRFLITPSYRYIDEPSFLEKLLSVNLETRKYLSKNTSVSLILNFRNAYIETTSGALISDTLSLSKLTNSVSVNLFSDGRDNILNPAKGYYLLLGYEYAGGFLGGYNRFDRVTIDIALFFPLIGDATFALHSLTGFTYPKMPAESISVDVRYEMGGWRSIRGYDEASIGWPDYRGKHSGLQILQINSEIRFKIYKKIYGYLFADAGNLWMSQDEIKFSDLYSGVGFGIGFLTPVGPIRLDFARSLTVQGDKKIYLNIGNPF